MSHGHTQRIQPVTDTTPERRARKDDPPWARAVLNTERNILSIDKIHLVMSLGSLAALIFGVWTVRGYADQMERRFDILDVRLAAIEKRLDGDTPWRAKPEMAVWTKRLFDLNPALKPVTVDEVLADSKVAGKP